MNEKKGKQSIKFGNPPYILGAGSGGAAEGDRRPHGEIF